MSGFLKLLFLEHSDKNPVDIKIVEKLKNTRNFFLNLITHILQLCNSPYYALILFNNYIFDQASFVGSFLNAVNFLMSFLSIYFSFNAAFNK